MSALEVKKPKPAAMDHEFVAPMITDEAGRTLIRSMRMTDKLQDLMDFYYAMVPAIPRGTGVFLYQGKRVDGEKTPVDYKFSSGTGLIDFLSEMKPDIFVTLTVCDSDGRTVTSTMRPVADLPVEQVGLKPLLLSTGAWSPPPPLDFIAMEERKQDPEVEDDQKIRNVTRNQ
ncbi:hypothetical protein PR202_gb21373 [Eleusine coracana subsp. coracana]|uniref:Uncharacterized protein n=1 Tax=Eleusine coracana subsp. coracana TaxID=191504 RepID=A0AAV5FEZ7_ELECO|nr:hypothetical protein PR202_gb21373 [Eleusine coracana subsp. coracana]